MSSMVSKAYLIITQKIQIFIAMLEWFLCYISALQKETNKKVILFCLDYWLHFQCMYMYKGTLGRKKYKLRNVHPI